MAKQPHEEPSHKTKGITYNVRPFMKRTMEDSLKEHSMQFTMLVALKPSKLQLPNSFQFGLARPPLYAYSERLSKTFSEHLTHKSHSDPLHRTLTET